MENLEFLLAQRGETRNKDKELTEKILKEIEPCVLSVIYFGQKIMGESQIEKNNIIKRVQGVYNKEITQRDIYDVLDQLVEKNILRKSEYENPLRHKYSFDWENFGEFRNISVGEYVTKEQLHGEQENLPF